MAEPFPVTFVGHDASLTGAPVVLLGFLRWLASRHGRSARLVLLAGGPLEARFRDVTEVVRADSRGWSAAAAARAGLTSVGWTAVGAAAPGRLRRAVRSDDTGLVVANTLAALAPTLSSRPGAPVVCHVHELDGVADRVLPPGPARSAAIDAVAGFVAAGPAVGTMLVERWGVDPPRVRVVDEFVDDPGPRLSSPRLGGRLTVMASGALGPRKGSDYFLELMRLVASDTPSVDGVWLGAPEGPLPELRADLRRAGLEHRVAVRTATTDPLAQVATADLLVSTSREDPFPVAVLEAGALGVPVAGFASGGIRDMFVAAGIADLCVEVGDVVALASVVVELLRDGTFRRRVAERWGNWVRTTHLTDHIAPLLWDAYRELGSR